MGILGEGLTYARFLRGFPDYFSGTLTLREARARIRERLARREENLIAMAETLFYGHPSSPYRPLLDLAGCGPGDFARLVKDRGVEGALADLREAGVYFTFEEYKGRQPVVRDGREIPIAEWQFDNPTIRHFYRSSTSGSTGRPSTAHTGLDHLEILAEHRVLLFDAHGVSGLPFVIWRPPLPSGSGLNNLLRMGRLGSPAVRWFTPLVPGHYRPELKYRLSTWAAVMAGRACGVRLVHPEPVALEDAGRIARFMADAVAKDGGVVLSTTVSSALRIGIAAREGGVDLTGAYLLIAGEPATAAKVRGIEASGASWFSDYGAAEMGRIALGCPHPEHHTDLHVTMDTAAVILHPRKVPGSDEVVRSIHVTSLVPTMPKVLLNLELDDFAEASERRCGCPLEGLGLTMQIRGVRSFRKLVGEGVSLIGSDMIDILETVLPARFGGSPLSYQLVEDEDERGFTRLNLFVSPSVPIPDESAVVAAVYEALDERSVAAGMARGFWESAGTLRVVRRDPLVSARAKQMPIRVIRSTPDTEAG